MADTNVELSKNESDIITNSEFILTKNRIIEKVYTMFGKLSEVYKAELAKHSNIFPKEIYSASPKIYKGENYLNLPYVMMDYPRTFLKHDVFAIRSFFWWGNYFSLTLQLSGKYLDNLKDNIAVNLQKNINSGYFICVNNDEWQHHFEETNYTPLTSTGLIEKAIENPFLKIARKHSLSGWNSAVDFFEKSYAGVMQLMN